MSIAFRIYTTRDAGIICSPTMRRQSTRQFRLNTLYIAFGCVVHMNSLELSITYVRLIESQLLSPLPICSAKVNVSKQ